LLQIHWPDRYVPLFGSGPYNPALERVSVPIEEQLLALTDLVKAGKVRYLGLSNETPYGVMKFTQLAEKLNLPKVISIQNSYSLIVRSDFESGLAEVCHKESVGLLAYSPLAGGILTGKYASGNVDKNARLNLFEGYMSRYKQSLAQTAVARYAEVAAKHDISLVQLALGWCYSRPLVASTIIGATSVNQLRENLDAFHSRDKITDEVVNDINSVYKQFRDPATSA